jgi:hypothetical protein
VLSIIYQDANYEANLILSGLTSLRDRHKNACMKLFIKIKQNPDHKLAGLLPPENCSCYNLRKPRELVVPPYKTNRFSKCFFLPQQGLIIVNSTQQLLLLYIYTYIYIYIYIYIERHKNLANFVWHFYYYTVSYHVNNVALFR